MYCTHTYTSKGSKCCMCHSAGHQRLGSNAEGTADTTSSFKWGWAGSQSHNGTARENTWLLKETAYFYDKWSLLVMWLHSSWRDPVISWAARRPGPLKPHLHTHEWSHPFPTMSRVQLRNIRSVYSVREILHCCCLISCI